MQFLISNLHFKFLYFENDGWELVKFSYVWMIQKVNPNLLWKTQILK
jgi:hypothetical protein